MLVAVLSYSEPEGSEFSGFGSEEVPAQAESQPAVEKSKNKKKKDKGKRPANPKSSATAKKSKPNQRTNGPVNAHLISWPTLVKHKHIKPEKYMVKK